MTITNHLLAGSLIGIAVNQPELAIVLAYSSHFVMDSLPHYGDPKAINFTQALNGLKKNKLDQVFVALTVITFPAVLVLLLAKRDYFITVVGLVAVLPDMILLLNYILYEKKGKEMSGPIAWLNLKFHGKIQFHRPWGIYTEIFVFVALSALLLKQI